MGRKNKRTRNRDRFELTEGPTWISQSAPLAEMWSAFTAKFADEGTLRKLIIENDNPEIVGPLIVRPMLDSSSRPVGATAIPGYLHMLPEFSTDEEYLITQFVYLESPWAVPDFMGVVGYPRGNEDHGRTWILTYEQPIDTGRTVLAHGREDEEYDLERFCTDFQLHTGHTIYDSFRRGNDPPDFVAVESRGTVTVECTRLTSEKRRSAHALLAHTRESIIEQLRKDRKAFRYLVGSLVFLRFADTGFKTDLPPKLREKEKIDAIIAGLKSYRFSEEPTMVDFDDGVETTRDNYVDVPNVCTLHATPYIGALPSSEFFQRTGFEIGIGMKSVHTYDDSWKSLEDLILRKDRPGNEDLVISVGAPTRGGIAFSSDELVAEIALGSQGQPEKIEHLKRVFVHFQLTRRIVQVWPQRIEITRPDLKFVYRRPHTAVSKPSSIEPMVPVFGTEPKGPEV